MTRRMGAAALSLAGILVSAYLFLYKRGAIGTLACGDGGCETVQLSRYSAFLGVDVALIGLLGTPRSREPARPAAGTAGAAGHRNTADRPVSSGCRFAAYLTTSGCS
jgi:hypothetical protein